MTSTAVPGGTKPAKPGQPAQKQAASREAQRLAAAILEVLAGVRTPTDAAEAVGLSLPTYYQWEQRALEGLVAGCEPRPVGQAVSQRHRIAVLQKEVVRLKQDCARQQALVRASQRMVGLGPPPAAKPAVKGGEKGTAKPNGKKPKKRRPTARALKAAAALQAASDAGESTVEAASVAATEVLQQDVEASLLQPPTLAEFAPNGF